MEMGDIYENAFRQRWGAVNGQIGGRIYRLLQLGRPEKMLLRNILSVRQINRLLKHKQKIPVKGRARQ